MGAIPLADQKPLHVRIGHASRRRHHGCPRTSGGARNSERWEGGLMSAEKRMAETRDVIIVGGGHNGLVAAFYLAKAGFKPLVLNAAPRWAERPSPKNFIPASAAPCWRTTPARFAPTSCATCNWRSTA